MTHSDKTSEQTRVFDPDVDRPQAPSGVSLIVLHSPLPDLLGQRFDVTALPLTLGRTGAADIVLPEDSVSRLHARLGRSDEGFVVEDLGSTNGTFVNREAVHRPTPALAGDKISVGRTVLKLIDPRDEEARFYEQSYRMAMTDPLTGLHNKRSFLQASAREISRARRHERPLGLAMIDVDHFKSINDTYGHLAGDAVLVQLAQVMGGSLRSHDIIGRYGGEEFAVVFPETPLTGTMTAAEKIRACVEEHPFTHAGDLIPVTVSLGCTALHPIDRRPEDLIRRADERLYQAKASGRNRVES